MIMLYHITFYSIVRLSELGTADPCWSRRPGASSRPSRRRSRPALAGRRLCMKAYVYIYIYIHVCTYVYMYICTYVSLSLYIYIYIHIHVYVCIYRYPYIYTLHMHKCTHSCFITYDTLFRTLNSDVTPTKAMYTSACTPLMRRRVLLSLLLLLSLLSSL